jgi:hypothetical protein
VNAKGAKNFEWNDTTIPFLWCPKVKISKPNDNNYFLSEVRRAGKQEYENTNSILSHGQVMIERAVHSLT